ncbi:helix-turn-helix transcriptional regulator, partial [uncultured Brevundimonas sp.]|uniref:helix-turn-helix transcriptional regulator n=1 Tax=uncultured Brevundimonas sp. TaxID=213418 RepID=UPI0025CFF4F0
REARRAAAVRDLFGLTAAEAVVAARLAEGLGPQAVAQGLQVRIGTVRTHIRRIYEKCEVNSQIELVALLARL